MTAKEFLNRAYRVDEAIDSKLRQIKNMRDLVEKTTTTISDMPHSGSHDPHKFDGIIAKIVDLEDEIRNDMNDLIDAREEVVHVLSQVKDNDLRAILERRYLCFDSWERISSDMGYSLQWTFHLHKKAVHEVAKLIKTE